MRADFELTNCYEFSGFRFLFSELLSQDIFNWRQRRYEYFYWSQRRHKTFKMKAKKAYDFLNEGKEGMIISYEGKEGMIISYEGLKHFIWRQRSHSSLHYIIPYKILLRDCTALKRAFEALDGLQIARSLNLWINAAVGPCTISTKSCLPWYVDQLIIHI